MSHKSVWCPLRDIEALLTGGDAYASVVHNGKMPFFQSYALHYLCHSSKLENLNAHDFYSQYEVVKVTSSNRDSLLYFVNDEFQHPSFQMQNHTFLQGVKARSEEHLIKVFQYDFPDTVEFGGSILNPDLPINPAMEKVLQMCVAFFLPCSRWNDIHVQYSYTLKFCEAIQTSVIGEKAMNFLQNMQDARSNCLHIGKVQDNLQRENSPYIPADIAFDEEVRNEEEEEIDQLDGEQLDEILKLLQDEANDDSCSKQSSCNLPVLFDVSTMWQKGVLKSRFESLAGMNMSPESQENIVQLQQLTTPGSQNDATRVSHQEDQLPQPSPTRQDIVRILLNRTMRCQRTFKEITKRKEPVEVIELNGSVESIMDWAVQAKLNKRQQHAFEIIVGTFVLSIYSDDRNNTEFGRGVQSQSPKFIHEKMHLEVLVERGKQSSDQLICLLHGLGGCGKTTVMDLSH